MSVRPGLQSPAPLPDISPGSGTVPGPRPPKRVRAQESGDRAVVTSSAKRPGRWMLHPNRSTLRVPSPAPSAVPTATRCGAAGVTAVLGPTNTGKTHLAIERMLAHPVRHHRAAAAAARPRGVQSRGGAGRGRMPVALITGEEKIKPKRPRFWVCHRGGHATRPRCVVSWPSTKFSSRPGPRSRPRVHGPAAATGAGRDETLVIGASTMQRIHRASCCPVSTIVSTAAPVEAHLRGREASSPVCRPAPPSWPFRPRRSTPSRN